MKNAVSKLEFDRCLDAVVDLTRYHNPQAITTALHDALRSLVPAPQWRLFDIANDNRDSEFSEQNIQNAVVRDLFDAQHGKPFPLADDDELVRCLRTRNRISSDSGGRQRLIIPVFGALDIWALLVIEGVSEITGQYDMLARLLRVYSNQMHMLSRSEIDPLTGLYNRQSFYERLTQLAQRGAPRRRGSDARTNYVSTHCFALLDVDHFKLVNDQYGHLIGDEVLLQLARLIMRTFRHDDMFFRYGGEEFAIVLVNLTLENATNVLERFRAAVEAYAFPRVGQKTVSIGFTTIDVKSDIEKVVMSADKALYYAKNHGRNRACCYEKLVATGELEPIAATESDIELF